MVDMLEAKYSDILALVHFKTRQRQAQCLMGDHKRAEPPARLSTEARPALRSLPGATEALPTLRSLPALPTTDLPPLSTIGLQVCRAWQGSEKSPWMVGSFPGRGNCWKSRWHC
jgi:hypothetical protein